MALTDLEWTRFAGGPITFSGWPAGVFTRFASTTSPLTAFVPWTLIRTELEVVVAYTVAAGAGLHPDLFLGGNVRVGVKHSPDGTDPGMVHNDEAKAVLGIRHLVPEFTGDPSGTGAYAVTYRLLTPFENLTKRGAQGNTLSVVYAYLWATSDGPGLDQGLPNVRAGYSYQMSTLWGR